MHHRPQVLQLVLLALAGMTGLACGGSPPLAPPPLADVPGVYVLVSAEGGLPVNTAHSGEADEYLLADTLVLASGGALERRSVTRSVTLVSPGGSLGRRDTIRVGREAGTWAVRGAVVELRSRADVVDSARQPGPGALVVARRVNYVLPNPTQTLALRYARVATPAPP